MLLTYRYLHLMFVFTTTWGYKYAVATATDQGWATRAVTDAEALQLLGGQELRPSLWKRFSIFLLLGVVLLVVVVAALSGYPGQLEAACRSGPACVAAGVRRDRPQSRVSLR